MNRKHLAIMLLCCLIPVGMLAAVYVFRVQLNSALWFGVMLLCPVLHLLMMKFMMDDHGHQHTQAHHEEHSHGAAPASTPDQPLS